MKTGALVLSLMASAAADCANGPWDQCGGEGFAGDTCCPDGYECKYDNDYYSGCSLKDLCLVVQFGQCDGIDEDGNAWPDDQKCCPDGFECTYQSQYYSQCTESGSNTTDCSGPYEQCGPEDVWDGPLCCSAGYECTPDATNPDWYSGCTPIPVCTNAAYGQCGGVDSDGNAWTDKHDTCCPDGFECQYQSQYYSQCLENSDAPKQSDGKHVTNFAKVKASQPWVGDEPCKSDSDCTDGADPHCVVESEYYSACVDCGPASFAQQCGYMSGSFLAAAEATCGLGCDGRCPGGTDAECTGVNATSCVKTDSGDSCLDCSSQKAFDDTCFYMADDWIIAAQAKCGLDCTKRCPNHVDSDCADGVTCVVQGDGYWDQCVNCADEDSYQAECIYWSDDMRAAAQDKCGLACNMTAVTK